MKNVPEGIRTPDKRLRRPLLYPAELQAQANVSLADDLCHTLTVTAALRCVKPWLPKRSNRCEDNYRHARKKMERVMGIGPTQPAWKAGILPLNYTRTSTAFTLYIT